jgi:hypothetical protein
MGAPFFVARAFVIHPAKESAGKPGLARITHGGEISVTDKLIRQ